MLIRILAALCTVFAVSATWADHESAATILSQTGQYASRTYNFRPAKEIKTLTTQSNRETQTFVEDWGRNLFSVVVFDKGSIIAETYAGGATAETPVNLYSAAKSLTALAVGEALCAGKIKSLDDTAASYAPAIKDTAYGTTSIRHLLGYTSGAKDPGGTGYSGVHSSSDFGSLIRQEISLEDLLHKHGEPDRYAPGEKFVYNGLNSEALSLVIRGATGTSLPQWFENTVWQKAGGEFPMAWFVDKQSNGVGEALVWMTTRDLLRIGMYTLDRLTNQSTDTCMNHFVNEAAQPRSKKGYWISAPEWGLGFHIGADKNIWFFGHGAQRLAINVKTRRILVINGYKEWRGFDSEAQRFFNR